MHINDDKISMTNSINNHKYLELSLFDFIKSQINIKIYCNICKNNKILYNKNFYLCSCGIYICELCSNNHNITHFIIEYNKRYEYCYIHQKEFISFCYNCKKNLCQICEPIHFQHKIILSYLEYLNGNKCM